MNTSPSACPLDCPDACGLLIETNERGEFTRLRGNPEHGWSKGHLCGKTAIYADMACDESRLREPLIRKGGELVRASWEEAIEMVAARLDELGGEDVLACSYAGNMGVVQRGYPYRLMNSLGAVMTDGGICDHAAEAGFECVLGDPIGPDLEEAGTSDALVIWGLDARRTNQHLMPVARELTRRGDPVLVIDIYETDTMRQVRRWGGEGLVLRPGSDAALALGLAARAFESGQADEEFLRRECRGVSEFRAHLATGYGEGETIAATGLEPDRIARLYDVLRGARRPILKTGVGWTRRRNGAMSMRAVCSLAAVLGIADRVHFESAGHFGLADDCVRRRDLRPAGSPSAPIRHAELGRELVSGRFRAVVVWGHNPLLTAPDSVRVQQGFAREDLFTVVHELFPTETTRYADVVLPATSVAEHTDVLKSYGHRRLQLTRRAAKPWGSSKSNVDTFRALSRALGLPSELWEQDEEALCHEYLDANRERIGDEALRSVLAGRPTKLPPRARRGRGTPSGQIELWSASAMGRGQPPMATWVPDDATGAPGSHWLIAAPSIHTHNSTYLHSARHAKRRPPAQLFVHPHELARLRLDVEQRVRVHNEHGELVLPLAADAGLPADCVRVDGLFAPDEVGQKVGLNALTGPALSDLGEGFVQFSHRVSISPL